MNEFLAGRGAARLSSSLSVKSMSLPLEFLRGVGVVPVESSVAVVDDPVRWLLEGDRRFLLVERGLMERAVLVRYAAGKSGARGRRDQAPDRPPSAQSGRRRPWCAATSPRSSTRLVSPSNLARLRPSRANARTRADAKSASVRWRTACPARGQRTRSVG